MTSADAKDSRPPLRWRFVGLLSGVGPGLIVAGMARLIGEAVGSGGGAITIAGTLGLLAGPGLALLLASRGARRTGVTRQNAPALVAYAATAFVGAVILPGRIAALAAIGIGAVVRIGVALAAAIGAPSQHRPSN